MQSLLPYISDAKIVLTIICIIPIIYIIFSKDKSKIDITDIIKEHIKTLKIFGSERVSINDISVFFILPIFISIILVLYIKVDDTRIGIIVTAFTIFIGLLFNILAILLAFDGERNKQVDKKFIKEVLYNVSFAIVVSILVLVVSILRFISLYSYMYLILDFILFYLIVLFVLTLFMVLKRLFNLLVKKIDNI
jgi:hypothetical protein